MVLVFKWSDLYVPMIIRSHDAQGIEGFLKPLRSILVSKIILTIRSTSNHQF
jgi:hypothetical protein